MSSVPLIYLKYILLCPSVVLLRYGSKNAVRAAISQRSQKRLTKDKKRLGSLHLAYIISKIYIKSKDFIHPRCGENNFLPLKMLSFRGSPPQVRGKLYYSPVSGTSRGITPAGAGKTYLQAIIFCVTWDHPRRCGENGVFCPMRAKRLGSPPQVRGKRVSRYCAADSTRITPAGAGKTLVQQRHCQLTQDHPRRCGENMEKGGERQ